MVIQIRPEPVRVIPLRVEQRASDWATTRLAGRSPIPNQPGPSGPGPYNLNLRKVSDYDQDNL